MYTESVKTLAEAVNEYYSQYELEELCGQFDIHLVYSGTKPDHLKMSKKVMADLDTENNWRFLHALLEDLLVRCRQTIDNLPKSDNLYHQQMIPQLQKFKRMLVQRKPSAKYAGRHAEVKIGGVQSALETFFAGAKTDLTVVDTELGAVVLEFLAKVKNPIKMLTRQTLDSFERDFFKSLKQFRQKGHRVEIRRHADIHDRVILFNNRCWLAAASLKDAGAGDYKLVELIDFKKEITRKVEAWWKKAESIIIG